MNHDLGLILVKTDCRHHQAINTAYYNYADNFAILKDISVIIYIYIYIG